MDERQVGGEPGPQAAESLTGRLAAFLADLASGTARSIATWRQRNQLEQELNALGDAELADLGIGREQIAAIVSSHPDGARPLHRMMEKLGVAERLLASRPELARAMERSCATCEARKPCGHWLETMAPALGYRDFCPNAADLDRLRRETIAAPD